MQAMYIVANNGILIAAMLLASGCSGGVDAVSTFFSGTQTNYDGRIVVEPIALIDKRHSAKILAKSNFKTPSQDDKKRVLSTNNTLAQEILQDEFFLPGKLIASSAPVAKNSLKPTHDKTVNSSTANNETSDIESFFNPILKNLNSLFGGSSNTPNQIQKIKPTKTNSPVFSSQLSVNNGQFSSSVNRKPELQKISKSSKKYGLILKAMPVENVISQTLSQKTVNPTKDLSNDAVSNKIHDINPNTIYGDSNIKNRNIVSSEIDLVRTLSSLFSGPTTPEVGSSNIKRTKQSISASSNDANNSKLELVSDSNKATLVGPDSKLIHTLSSLFDSPLTAEKMNNQGALSIERQTRLAAAGNVQNTLTAPQPTTSEPAALNHLNLNSSAKRDKIEKSRKDSKINTKSDSNNPVAKILNGVASLLAPQKDPITEGPNTNLKPKPRSTLFKPNMVSDGELDLAHFKTEKRVLRTPLPLSDSSATNDNKLKLGSNIFLGQVLDLARQSPAGCIEKRSLGSHFCVEPVAWPAEAATSFNISSAIYLGEQAVVRYDRGRATQAYAIFAIDQFVNVIKHLQKVFGPPSSKDIVWMHMLEAPRIPNPTFRWKHVSSDGEVETFLEVRNFDNYRKSYADTKNGFILLTRKGMPDMFTQLSTMDLMRLEKRRISMTPIKKTGQ